MTATKTLSPKTIEIVKSTVPVLEQHGEAITTRFYKIMFENHPELLNIFNHTHQKQGRQPRALANAVYAAAKYIDNLEVIVPVVKQIGHKHRSLNILPEHYPIVGKHLLLAIKDVLGDAATDEIIDAWAEAYGVIADVFISVEKEMYDEAEGQTGGWAGFRSFVVHKKVKESNVITSFYLKPEDGKAIASFKPGQYITVKAVINGEEYTHMRQYSLSDSPNNSYYRISVKREAENGAVPGTVSNFLHDHVNEGDKIDITAPAGDFVLNTDSKRPVVLISGGVGLTPMVSMLNTLVEQYPEREVTFIHAARNGAHHAMKDHVAHLANKYQLVRSFTCYEAPTDVDIRSGHFDKEGYITLEWLKTIISSTNAEFYFCGPVPFMKAIYEALKEWGVDEEDIHYEFFGPAGNLQA